MARLLNRERDAIVSQIMADIPVIDYVAPMRKRAVAIGVEIMPPAVKRVYEDRATSHFIIGGTHHLDCMSLYVPGYSDAYDSPGKFKLKTDPEIQRLHKLHDEQTKARETLRRDLSRHLYSVSTDKEFRERFPDLAKYCPEGLTPKPVIANLPATTALIDSLKAAGLPMQKVG